MELIGIQRVRGRDLATGIVLGFGFGLAALFLYLGTNDESTTGATISILFGSIFAIPSSSLPLVLGLGAITVAIIATLYRPLLLVSVSPELAAARGIPRAAGRRRLPDCDGRRGRALRLHDRRDPLDRAAGRTGRRGAAAHQPPAPGDPRRSCDRPRLHVARPAARLGQLLLASVHHGWPVSFFIVTLVLLGLPGVCSPERTPPEARVAMFSGFMMHAWIVATLVAIVGGAVGFFIVMRGSAFVAHAIPNGSFAGAAGASLVGVSTLLGLGVFSLGGALGIGLLSRRGRHDVATALSLVFMLGLGALFLSFSVEYAPAVYSLLFGEVLGISDNEIWPTIGLTVVCLSVLAVLWRPLLLSSVLPEGAQGLDPFKLELAFLVLVALATTVTVPVVGTALIFSLMIGPPAAARAFTARPGLALALSVAIAVGIVWAAIALSYNDQLAGRLLRRRM